MYVLRKIAAHDDFFGGAPLAGAGFFLSCSFRYASNAGREVSGFRKIDTLPGSATQSSSQMDETRCSSWETTRSPPSKESSAWSEEEMEV